MSTVIIDYGSGNLRSAAKAFERAVAEGGFRTRVLVSGRPEDVTTADRVVLPGVGAFGDCRHGLDNVPGMIDALHEAVIEKAKPFLGICVGMQLLARVGHEHGLHAGFDWIPGEVKRLIPSDNGLKIPHMGWNALKLSRPKHPALAGVMTGDHAYFVHSYGLVVEDHDHLLATCEYGVPIAAVVGRDNLVGTQFHPEKSQRVGLRLISNFLAWRP